MPRSLISSTACSPLDRARLSRHAGFSLIEVMVTLVILSFGLLGVAGLLVRGISNASASESMAKASQLAADMADRIRANPVVAVAAGNEYLRSFGDAPPADALTIAKNDMRVWLAALAAQLPQGDGQITAGTRALTIQVHWSNCLGTLSNVDQAACKNNSATAFKVVSFELRL